MTVRPSNSYSRSWFDFFHVAIGAERTKKEVEFICAVAPLRGFSRVLDVCCGMGRHARALAVHGYSVTGIERDPVAVSRARLFGGGPHYIETDVREYRPDLLCDLVIIMSQSFGYFDAATNREVLQRLGRALRPGGRLILDLWNPGFFAKHQGKRTLETSGGIVEENKRIENKRLFVRLVYPDGETDEFEWQLFTRPEMESVAGSVGFDLVISCTDFDAGTKPGPEDPRIQFVLQKWEEHENCSLSLDRDGKILVKQSIDPLPK